MLLTDDGTGTADSFTNNVPDGLELGGYNGMRNVTSEVSELIMYNRVLSDAELFASKPTWPPSTASAIHHDAAAVTKDGTGTVTLAGNNSYTAPTTVNAGTLVAAHPNALGTTAAGTTVNSGATLGFSNNVTLSGEALSLNGTGTAGQPGALANISGNNFIAATSPITAQVVAGGQLGIGSASGTLTIDSSIDQKLSNVVVNGAGSVVINGVISSSQTTYLDPTQRDVILGNPLAGLPGYGPLSFWEFNQPAGSATDSGTTNTSGTLTGAATRSTGRTGVVGTDYALDARAGGSVTTVVGTQYNSINTNDKVTLGFWAWQDPTQPTRANTTFQALSSAGGNNRVAFTHAFWSDQNVYWDAGTSGERVQANVPSAIYTDGWHHYIFTKSSSLPNFQAIYRDGVQIASGTGSQTFADIASLTIAPDYRGQMDDVFLLDRALTAADVTNLWNARNGLGVRVADNRLIKTGTGTLTLANNNSYSGATAVYSGVLVAAHPNALGTTAVGTSVLNGGTLALKGGITLAAEPLTINGLGATGQPGALVNADGNTNVIPATTSVVAQAVSGGQIGVGAVAGTLVIDAPVNLQYSKLVADGAGNTTINSVISSTIVGPTLANLNSFATGDYAFATANNLFSTRVSNDGTNSWLLIGRGREGWDMDSDGQGNIAALNQGLGSGAAFSPVALGDTVVNELLVQSGINNTNVEIRLRRATDTVGTTFQEARWRAFTGASFTFDFDLNGTPTVDDTDGYPVTYEVVSGSGSPFTDTTSNTNDTTITPDTDSGNDFSRVFTWPWANHNSQRGFSFGQNIGGADSNSGTSFLWEYTTENHAIPYTEVYIRKLSGPAPVTDNSLLKTGTGTLILTAANTFSGSTTISRHLATGQRRQHRQYSCRQHDHAGRWEHGQQQRGLPGQPQRQQYARQQHRRVGLGQRHGHDRQRGDGGRVLPHHL